MNNLRNFNEIFMKDVTFTNIISHKKAGLDSRYRKYSFGKTTVDPPPPPLPAFLGLKKNKKCNLL